MIVLDASAAIEWLVGGDEADAVAGMLVEHVGAVHAPHLLAVEVTQVLRRFVDQRRLGSDRAAAALDDLIALGVERHAHEQLLPLMWSLRANLTAYDAAYVALADVLEAPLVTCDRRLAVAPHGVRVHLVG